MPTTGEPKLVATLGLPASGKSSYARALVENEGFVRVNRDDLRSMLHVGEWSKEKEEATVLARDTLIRALLAAGYRVVCDDTNFGQLDHLRQLAQAWSADFLIHDLTHVPVEVCIKRDSHRIGKARVGEQVIRGMAEKNGLA